MIDLCVPPTAADAPTWNVTPMTSFIPFARPDVGVEEADAVREAILGGWLTTGDLCRQMEDAVAEAVGARHAVALNSGTAALHLSLEALGVRTGDLVVTTPYTFTATAQVIRQVGAVPLFVDVEEATFNISGEALEQTLDGLAGGDERFLPPSLRGTGGGYRPTAVMPVHIGGVACDLDRIATLAATHDLAVVEDAAHAFSGTHGHRPVGAPLAAPLRSTVCFSFYATKAITTGEGGMLLTDDPDVARQARLQSLHGISRDAWARGEQADSWRYEIVAPGFKYNMSDLAAAVGLVQLQKADAMLERRTAIAQRYNEAFCQSEALEIPTVPQDITSAWHLYMLRVDPDRSRVARDGLIAALRQDGIGSSVHFIPLHLHPYYAETYGYGPEDFPVATRAFEQEVSLPIYSAMSEAQVDRVIESVMSVMSGRHRSC